LARRGIPRDGALFEIRGVGHMASKRGVVSEHGIFDDWLAGAHRLEIGPEVRFLIVPRIALIGVSLRQRFFARRRIVLFVPLLDVLVAVGLREAGGGVVAVSFPVCG